MARYTTLFNAKTPQELSNRWFYRTVAALTLTILCFLMFYTVALATGEGTITALTASNGNPSTIFATLYASGGKTITNSNVVFQILDKNNVLVGTYGPITVSLDPLATQDITWSWPVNGAEPFTVSACWSPGNSNNCSIDNKTTSFSAVPSLGFVLSGFAVLLIGFWIWRTRRQMVAMKVTS